MTVAVPSSPRSHEITFYNMDVTLSEEVNWICVELFLTNVLLSDVLTHLLATPAMGAWSHMWSFYNIVDVLAFGCLAYPNVVPAATFEKFNIPCVVGRPPKPCRTARWCHTTTSCSCAARRSWLPTRMRPCCRYSPILFGGALRFLRFRRVLRFLDEGAEAGFTLGKSSLLLGPQRCRAVQQ